MIVIMVNPLFKISLKEIDFNTKLRKRLNGSNLKLILLTWEHLILTSNEGEPYLEEHLTVINNSKTFCLNIGLLAKKAVEAGLSVLPYIKTSLSPGSGVVTYYLKESGVIPYLTALGFDIVGYGCMTCIGNSGPLPETVVEAIEKVKRII